MVTALKPIHPREEIESARLVLRRHEESSAEIFFSGIDHDRERLYRFMSWVGETLSVDDTLTYIKSARESWKNYETFQFGIFRKSDNLHIGNIGSHNISWANRTIEIGYWILGAFESQGFVSEAVSVLEQELFRIGFHRVEIRCSSENARSARVPKRCGYKLEGVFKDQAIEQGVYRDTLVFAKLENYRAK